jgi:nucleotide-binding universal stress UspA family protein
MSVNTVLPEDAGGLRCRNCLNNQKLGLEYEFRPDKYLDFFSGSHGGSQMFRRILIPVDLTEKHQQAVDIAGQLASYQAGEVTLLHVIELIHGTSFDEERDFYRRLERKTRASMEQLATALKERGIAWRGEIRYGDRAAEVVRHAQEAGTELIVLTSHRIDLQHPGAGWGTLSYKIGILSQCPVLLVK